VRADALNVGRSTSVDCYFWLDALAVSAQLTLFFGEVFVELVQIKALAWRVFFL
jgi:hypothetical protein